jgi:hypothetical protein
MSQCCPRETPRFGFGHARGGVSRMHWGDPQCGHQLGSHSSFCATEKACASMLNISFGLSGVVTLLGVLTHCTVETDRSKREKK